MSVGSSREVDAYIAYLGLVRARMEKNRQDRA
jgi:hypothetical protein